MPSPCWSIRSDGCSSIKTRLKPRQTAETVSIPPPHLQNSASEAREKDMLGTAIGTAILLTAAGILFRKIRAFSRSKGQSGCDACPYCHSCRRTKVEKNK